MLTTPPSDLMLGALGITFMAAIALSNKHVQLWPIPLTLFLIYGENAAWQGLVLTVLIGLVVRLFKIGAEDE